MGSSKKRRKSVGKEENQPSKKTGGLQGGRQGTAPLTWKADGVQATLASDQTLLFLGRGSLTVSEGAVVLHGKVVQAGDAPVELCADERAGGPLLLEPTMASLEVPRVSEGAEVVLFISSSPAASTGIGDSRGGSGRGGHSFSVYLADDPEAPRFMPFGAPWQQAVAEIADSVARWPTGAPAVIAVSGSKRVGKSTFARQLVNTLLNTHPVVAFMDTDCGQTEFTPPGLVSLSMLTRPVLGPPHMHVHLQPPSLSFFMGDLSPACDPLLYLCYVREMFWWYCQHGAAAAAAAGGTAAATVRTGGQPCALPLPPLVVNTHGWVKGLGLDLLGELLQSLAPLTHFVQLCSPNPHKNLPEGVFWAPERSQSPPVLMWQLPALATAGDAQPNVSAVSQSSARTTSTTLVGGGSRGDEGRVSSGSSGRGLAPVEARALQWGAFAQQCIDAMRSSAGTKQQQAACLSGGGAASAASAELADGLAALTPWEVDMSGVEIQVLHSSVAPSQLPSALNCSLVGLCSDPLPQQQHSGSEPGPLPCLGLGIVRAVDASKQLLYILTPLPVEALERVTTLQVGKLELPSSLLQSGAYLSPYLCLFSLTSMGTGAGVIRSRNNLMRQSQL